MSRPSKRSNKRKAQSLSLNDEVAPTKSSLLSYFTPRQATASSNRYKQSRNASVSTKYSFSSSTPSSEECARSVCDTGTPSTLASSHRSSLESSFSSISPSTCISMNEKKIKTKDCSSKIRTNSAQQMYLDFGQKSFGQRTICKTCNHLYVNGQPDDEANHRTLCSQFQYGVPFVGWKNERVAKFLETNDRIIEVRSSDASQWQKKVGQVKQIADDEMGFVQSDKPLLENGEHAFLFIRSKRVVAMCIVQPIDHAYLMGENNVRSKEEYPATIGIYQIWVHQRHRRAGIANTILNTIRRKVLYGTVVPINMVAFSSPTESGAAFARKYTSSTSPKVYDC